MTAAGGASGHEQRPENPTQDCSCADCRRWRQRHQRYALYTVARMRFARVRGEAYELASCASRGFCFKQPSPARSTAAANRGHINVVFSHLRLPARLALEEGLFPMSSTTVVVDVPHPSYHVSTSPSPCPRAALSHRRPPYRMSIAGVYVPKPYHGPTAHPDWAAIARMADGGEACAMALGAWSHSTVSGGCSRLAAQGHRRHRAQSLANVSRAFAHSPSFAATRWRRRHADYCDDQQAVVRGSLGTRRTHAISYTICGRSRQTPEYTFLGVPCDQCGTTCVTRRESREIRHCVPLRRLPSNASGTTILHGAMSRDEAPSPRRPSCSAPVAPSRCTSSELASIAPVASPLSDYLYRIPVAFEGRVWVVA
uniref:Uncharacterized protein n=1 Tax=Mycena chlorophos TaxID=658473 RepID=A0ABQ0L590_MYCCL|nr:predicted protein [Mycena chlorophos]